MKVEDIVVLDEIDMMLHRPDTFVGSIEAKQVDTYMFHENAKAVSAKLTYTPALLKIFDEVIQNCYDHSKRPGGENLTKIDVTINQLTGSVSIADNAGIPVEMHPVYKMYAPCIIFGQLRSSTNYDDSQQREGGGRNGLGAKLTNIFSSLFKVETCDGKLKYEKTYENNRRDETDPVIKKGTIRGTKITFIPDWKVLKCTLDDDNYAMLVSRVYEIAACSPNIEVSLNGKRIEKGFENFVKKFSNDYLYIENTHWHIGIASSKGDGFRHVSFCNAIHTTLGGTHVDYLADQLAYGVRDYVKKKTKQDIKPADIRNHFQLFVDCTVMNPKFSSQTKEHMNLAISSYGTNFRFDESFLKRLCKSPIVAEIVEWAINKKKLQDMADMKKLAKDVQKVSPKDIEKYEPASQKINRHECILFVCEGNSASNPLISARDPRKHGVFALKGKPLNMTTAELKDIKKNVEIQNLMAALGLDFENPDVRTLRYGKIVLATDADQDGMHIRGLMLNNFKFQWPNLLLEEMVYFLDTPIVRVTKGKNKHEFHSIEEYEAWFEKQSGAMTVDFLKGLGAHDTADFKKYMMEDKYMVPLVYDETAAQMLELAFGDADDKKPWLGLE